MLTHSSLTSLFSDCAEAIRENGGTTEQIAADNFPAMIRQIGLRTFEICGKTFRSSETPTTTNRAVIVNANDVFPELVVNGAQIAVPSSIFGTEILLSRIGNYYDRIVVDAEHGEVKYVKSIHRWKATNLTSLWLQNNGNRFQISLDEMGQPRSVAWPTSQIGPIISDCYRSVSALNTWYAVYDFSISLDNPTSTNDGVGINISAQKYKPLSAGDAAAAINADAPTIMYAMAHTQETDITDSDFGQALLSIMTKR